MAPSIVWARGSQWGSSELNDGWGPDTTDEQVEQLVGLVLERFRELTQAAGVFVAWTPYTSEVIGDQDQDIPDDLLDELREKAISDVWGAVCGYDGVMSKRVAEVFA